MPKTLVRPSLGLILAGWHKHKVYLSRVFTLIKESLIVLAQEAYDTVDTLVREWGGFLIDQNFCYIVHTTPLPEYKETRMSNSDIRSP